MLWEWQVVETQSGKAFHGNQFMPRKMTVTAPVPSAVRFLDETALEIAQGCQSVGGTTAQPSTFPMSEIPAGVTAVQGRQEPKRCDRVPPHTEQARGPRDWGKGKVELC